MLTQSQIALLEMIKTSLFDKPCQEISEIDWRDVVSEAKEQTVLGLISPILPVQVESGEQVKAMYMRVMYEQDRLLKCFEAANIPCVILKGSAAAVYYPKPYLRSMGDIDVLVPRCRFSESLELLESNGYVYDHGKGKDGQIFDDTRELAYIKNGIYVEIHQRFSSTGFNIDNILESGIIGREYRVLSGYRFPVLPNSENGLVLLGHIHQHLNNNSLGLRQVIDWEMFVLSMSNSISFFDQFVSLLEKNELLTLAAYITRMCNKYLGLPNVVNWGIDVDDSIIDELLEVILTDGNFGRKVCAEENSDDKKIISASYGIRRYGFFGYFSKVGQATNNFCRMHSSLRLLAFICGVFRQITKGITSSFRSKNLRKSVVEGKRRNEVYQIIGIRNEE